MSSAESLRNDYINFLARHSKQVPVGLLRYTEKAPATIIHFDSDSVNLACRETAIDFLRRQFVSPQTALELTQELVAEIPTSELLKGHLFLFQLENTAVEIKYSPSTKGGFILVETTVHLFGDVIVNQFAFPCVYSRSNAHHCQQSVSRGRH